MFEGNPNDWIRCPMCESEEAVIIHWGHDNEVTLKCPECGDREDADWWNGLDEKVVTP